MEKTVLKAFIMLFIISPFLFLSIKNTQKETIKIVFILFAFIISHQCLLYIPIAFKELCFVGSKWNWSGKIYAILGSFVFLLCYRKFKMKDYFLTFNQNKSFVKKGTWIVVIVLSIHLLINVITFSPKIISTETIFYQLTMPGIDEEIAYRGIMLGLLIKVLKSNILIFNLKAFNPSIVITSILFGLAHGLNLSNSYEIIFNFPSFLSTFVMGVIWAWLTIKSGSILLAMLSHNLGNSSQIISFK